MEEPNSWVVSGETQDNVAVRSQNKGIPSHWDCWVIGLARIRRVKNSSLVFRPRNGLEVVAVKMERMLAVVC